MSHIDSLGAIFLCSRQWGRFPLLVDSYPLGPLYFRYKACVALFGLWTLRGGTGKASRCTQSMGGSSGDLRLEVTLDLVHKSWNWISSCTASTLSPSALDMSPTKYINTVLSNGTRSLFRDTISAPPPPWSCPNCLRTLIRVLMDEEGMLQPCSWENVHCLASGAVLV